MYRMRVCKHIKTNKKRALKGNWWLTAVRNRSHYPPVFRWSQTPQHTCTSSCQSLCSLWTWIWSDCWCGPIIQNKMYISKALQSVQWTPKADWCSQHCSCSTHIIWCPKDHREHELQNDSGDHPCKALHDLTKTQLFLSQFRHILLLHQSVLLVFLPMWRVQVWIYWPNDPWVQLPPEMKADQPVKLTCFFTVCLCLRSRSSISMYFVLSHGYLFGQTMASFSHHFLYKTRFNTSASGVLGSDYTTLSAFLSK